MTSEGGAAAPTRSELPAERAAELQAALAGGARALYTDGDLRALVRIAETGAALGDHLRQTVHTGVRCPYWPS